MNKLKENICRICLKTEDVLVSIFRRRKGISPLDQLLKHTKLNIKANDAGPRTICWDCFGELETTVVFLEKCEKSNEILSRTLSQCVLDKHSISNLDNFESSSVIVENLINSSQEDHLAKTESDEVNKSQSIKEYLKETGCPECGSKRRCQHWSPPDSYTCHQCGKTFRKKYNYQLHIKRHLRELDWSCPVCGLPQLTRWHAERHCAPRPRRPCPISGCNKTFTTNTNLKTHIRVHNGERPFKCDVCGKGFRCKNTLTEHIRIHTGEKPYICPVCGLRFRTNKLAVHVCTHASQPAVPLSRSRAHRASALATMVTTRQQHLRHACSLCSARYVHKQSLNKHLKNHHMQKSTNILTLDTKQL